MDLRTRYTALVTLITQYVKFASETLKRAEDEEVRVGRMSALPGGGSRAHAPFFMTNVSLCIHRGQLMKRRESTAIK